MTFAPVELDRFQPEDPVGEECGVFGVWAPDEDVAKLTYYGLYALQHFDVRAVLVEYDDVAVAARLQTRDQVLPDQAGAARQYDLSVH